MESRLIAYLQLFRLPNVFTALADILMGYVVSRAALVHESNSLLLILAGASALLYTAGMVLNDVHDVEQDARERPERPIPSGRIPLGVARAIGWEMLAFGAGLAWLASYVAADARPAIVGTLLAAAVWLYDAVLKPTPAAPLSMGACRFLNVLLGMSVAPAPWETAHFAIAAGVGIYVAGITWFARREAVAGHRSMLIAGAIVMLAGIGVLYQFPYVRGPFTAPKNWAMLWALVAGLIGWRVARAVADPSPFHIQAAVKHALFGLFMVDAGICLVLGGTAGRIWPLAILALALPAMALGRRIYST